MQPGEAPANGSPVRHRRAGANLLARPGESALASRMAVRQFLASLALAAVLGGCASTAKYVCPVHPSVQRNQPATCPTCGAALNREEVMGQDEQNSSERPTPERAFGGARHTH